MEKFTRWEDKACGINPFVPISTGKKNTIRKVFDGLVSLILFILRAPLVLILLPLLLIADALLDNLPLKRFSKTFICTGLARILIFLLGFRFSNEAVPDPRKLGFGRAKGFNLKYSDCIRDIHPGDIIINNNISFVQIIYLYSTFLPQFTASTEKGTFTISLSEALMLSVKDYSKQGNRLMNFPDISKVTSKDMQNNILVVFPEVVKSNGAGILKFSTSFSSLIQSHKICCPTGKTHVLGVCYDKPNYQLNHHLGGFFSYLWKSCGKFYSPMKINLIPDQILRSSSNSDLNEENTQKAVVFFRETLSKCSGKKVKCVELGIEEYFSFLDYYAGYNVQQTKKQQ